MKTLKNILGISESKKSMHNFLNKLDVNAMIRIKGGEGDDMWPPVGRGGG